jgi:hypothetical protein
MYNRIYYRTTFGLGRGCLVMIVQTVLIVVLAATVLRMLV